MRTISYSNQFQKDFKIIKKRGYDISKLKEILEILISNTPIALSYKDHALQGNLKGIRDLHIKTDWILLYEIVDNEIIIHRTGTHNDIFKNTK